MKRLAARLLLALAALGGIGCSSAPATKQLGRPSSTGSGDVTTETGAGGGGDSTSGPSGSGGAGGAVDPTCGPPFTCPTGAGGGEPSDKPDATPEPDEDPESGDPQAPCSDFEAAFATSLVLAGGPTPEFVAAFNAALDETPAGPFGLRLLGVDSSSDADHSALLFGVTSTDGYYMTPSEDAVEVAVEIAADRTLSIDTNDDFHLHFADVDIRVSSLELTGTLSTTCGQITNAQLTLHIPGTQGNKELGGQDLDELLGPKNDGNGWTVQLSGNLSEASIQ